MQNSRSIWQQTTGKPRGLPICAFISCTLGYWNSLTNEDSIRDALIELSKRHADKPTKMVVKLIVDRGSPKQVIKNHIPIPASEWEGLNLPRQDEIPNIDFEVMVSASLGHLEGNIALIFL